MCTEERDAIPFGKISEPEFAATQYSGTREDRDSRPRTIPREPRENACKEGGVKRRFQIYFQGNRQGGDPILREQHWSCFVAVVYLRPQNRPIRGLSEVMAQLGK